MCEPFKCTAEDAVDFTDKGRLTDPCAALSRVFGS